MQQCALESLPLLPNEISLGEHGLTLAGYASVDIPSAVGMAFFVNGMLFNDVQYPISDPRDAFVLSDRLHGGLPTVATTGRTIAPVLR